MISFLLSAVVVPHGITDIILSYETNNYDILYCIYLCIPLICIYMNDILYKYIFIVSSIIHFRHELSPVIPYYIMLNYFVGDVSYNESFNYIVVYLSLIHVPYHYYCIFSSTIYGYEHLSILIMFTSLSYKITHYFIDWIHIYQGQDKLSKFLGAIIMSHIYFNEYLILMD